MHRRVAGDRDLLARRGAGDRDLLARRVDRVATAVSLVVLIAVAAVLSWLGMFLSFTSNRCGFPDVVCDEALIRTGGMLAHYGPPLVAAVAVIASVLLLRAGHRSSWVPLLGIAIALAAFEAGQRMAPAGVTLVTGAG